ncbi:MAG: tetratricopeptide repeat protein [Cellvibrionaceae bacterium]|nr:tetratricopeptide repeat protein [Cellvibrionaceae bacterium]
MKSLQALILCALLGMTSGCASYSPSYGGEPEDAEYSASQISANTAVQNLYDQAMNYAHAGDYDQAEATLERGLRIEPNNAYLWFELARLSADYGNIKKARELASRAQSLAGGEKYLQGQIERFVQGL